MKMSINTKCLYKMGHLWSKVEWFWESFHKETSILVLGLDNAGKTATLYAMQLGEPMPYTIPTIGFNIETVKVKNIDIKMWDLGGQEKFRSLWPHYFEQTDGIAFVIDSSDMDRFCIVKEEIHTLISHKELVGKPFLFLANKQDLPNATSKEILIETLNLNAIKSSEWYIIECAATKNERAKIGFEWLANQL